MTLVTTPGDPAADSYAAVADADAYFAALGITTWTGSTTAKENALRRGTLYLDNQYRSRWRGIASLQTQALSWPRGDGIRELYRVTFLYPLLDIEGFPLATNVIPIQIRNAAIEAALMVLTGVDMQPRLVRGGQIKSQRSKVDVLEKETVWQDGAPSVDRYMVIEGLLRGWVTSTPGATSGTVKLVRS